MTTKKMALSYGDYVKGIRGLKPEEQLSLVEVISARLKKTFVKKKIRYSIMELEGLGANIYGRILTYRHISARRGNHGVS